MPKLSEIKFTKVKTIFSGWHFSNKKLIEEKVVIGVNFSQRQFSGEIHQGHNFVIISLTANFLMKKSAMSEMGVRDMYM